MILFFVIKIYIDLCLSDLTACPLPFQKLVNPGKKSNSACELGKRIAVSRTMPK